MTYEDFSEKFHEICNKYNNKLNDFKIEVGNEYLTESFQMFRMISNYKKNSDVGLIDEVGIHFKKMDTDDKFKFLKCYSSRDSLLFLLEPHELTAYRMLK